MNKHSEAFNEAAAIVDKNRTFNCGICKALLITGNIKVVDTFNQIMHPNIGYMLNRKPNRSYYFSYDEDQDDYVSPSRARNDRLLALAFLYNLSNKDLKELTNAKI